MRRTPLPFAFSLVALVALLAPPATRADDPPAAEPAPADPAPAPEAVPPPPGPSGMVYVDVSGKPRIGTSAEDIVKLVGKRKELLPELLFETPVFSPAMRAYFIDPVEVTNQQYFVYLEQFATTYKTGTTALSNLSEIASSFVYGDARRRPETSRRGGSSTS